MKDECFIYHISTKLKQNDHLYCHFNKPIPQMYIRTKSMYFFHCFFIDTCLMNNFITKIDTDRNYYFWAFIWYQNLVAGIIICVKMLSGNL